MVGKILAKECEGLSLTLSAHVKSQVWWHTPL